MAVTQPRNPVRLRQLSQAGNPYETANVCKIPGGPQPFPLLSGPFPFPTLLAVCAKPFQIKATDLQRTPVYPCHLPIQWWPSPTSSTVDATGVSPRAVRPPGHALCLMCRLNRPRSCLRAFLIVNTSPYPSLDPSRPIDDPSHDNGTHPTFGTTLSSRPPSSPL
ncbi:hypothetical protein BJ322DRAFT_219253 [Thelephora terrestris]|uniref:Uncharacterized protein n=1 Tax=Thelephora terrestris TaxID=56493 RepID=A0A9P6H9J8_9AGAM|nr:hypothetical protein BJ322DRAFT_219253 [Thelephora terrestris]